MKNITTNDTNKTNNTNEESTTNDTNKTNNTNEESTTNDTNKTNGDITTNDTNKTNSTNVYKGSDNTFVNIREDIRDIRGKNDTNIIYKDECYQIYHAIYEVHNKLGNGFLESVYQEAMEIELKKQNIPFESQKMIHIYYDEKALTQYFKADIICFDKILLELKAATKITNEHKAQVINYLAATKIKLGLLVNFGAYPKVEICRIVL